MDIRDIIRAAGGPVNVARLVQRKHSTVSEWVRVPAEFVSAIAAASGLAPHVIRPDVFPAAVGAADRAGNDAGPSTHNPVVAQAQQ
jgi:hypothetical protein